MRSKYFSFVVACLFGLPLCAVAGTPYNVDDPGTAEPRHLVIDLAAITSQVRGSESGALPSVGFGYGLTNTVELDFGSSLSSLRNSGSARVSGLGDTSLGAKWRFQEESASRPQFAVTGQIKIPTASRSRGLGSGRYDYTPGLCLAKSFGKYSFCTGAGYNFVGDPDGKSNAFYGVCLTYQTTETLTVGAQLYGNTADASGERDELAYGVGLSCNYRPDQTAQLMVGRSMHGLSDLNVYAGLEFVFGPKAAPDGPPVVPPASDK